MIRIGELLRSTRNQKGFSLEKVADETNIAKRYLAALEAEDFSIFPGDPYVVGFLRNYAEYLGLPSDELAAAYKNLRIQEQPTPIQDLIPKRGSSLPLVGSILAVSVLAMAVLVLLFLNSRMQPVPDSEAALEHKAPVEYRIESSRFEKRLFIGDSILVDYLQNKYKLLISNIDDGVSLETPSGPIRLILGEEGTIDLDRNNEPDLKVLISDLAKRDPGKGAVLRIDFASAEAANRAATEIPTTSPDAAQAAFSGGDFPARLPVSQPEITATTAAGGKSIVLIEAGKTPYPFVVSVTFRSSCLFRYEVDRRDRDERYYRKGDTITVNATNGMKIWASNGQSAKIAVSGGSGKYADFDLGGPGEVSVKRIAWVQADTGNWILSAFDVD